MALENEIFITDSSVTTCFSFKENISMGTNLMEEKNART